MFRLDKGNLRPAFTAHLTTCSLLVADAEDDGSLVIIPFTDLKSGLPRDVTHQVFEKNDNDAASEGKVDVPGSEKQVSDEQKNNKLKVSASCICTSPDYSKPLTLTSNTLYVIPGK